MVREIPLTRGLVAIVDDEDFETLNQFKWHAKRTNNGRFYASRTEYRGGKKTIFMHKVILGIGSELQGDHRDGNSLNNVRKNLRPATQQQNKMNCAIRRDSRSGLKGVHQRGSKWRMVITADGVHYRSLHNTAREAAEAYDAMAIKLHGEFARLNFPSGHAVTRTSPTAPQMLHSISGRKAS